MRSPLVQQWAGIIALSFGLSLWILPLGLFVFGVFCFLGGLGRELEKRRRTVDDVHLMGEILDRHPEWR